MESWVQVWTADLNVPQTALLLMHAIKPVFPLIWGYPQATVHSKKSMFRKKKKSTSELHNPQITWQLPGCSWVFHTLIYLPSSGAAFKSTSHNSSGTNSVNYCYVLVVQPSSQTPTHWRSSGAIRTESQEKLQTWSLYNTLSCCSDTGVTINRWFIKVRLLKGREPICGFMITQIQKVKLPIKLAPNMFPWNV